VLDFAINDEIYGEGRREGSGGMGRKREPCLIVRFSIAKLKMFIFLLL
jgi:hypothetical protein